MQLLVLIIIAFVIGYWLSRSKYHEPIDNAAQQPKHWWNRLFRRSESGGISVEQSNPGPMEEK